MVLYTNDKSPVEIDARTRAIIVGRNITIDGFANKPVRVVTHVHADHVVGINDSILHSKEVVATPITNDLMVELGYIKKNLIPLFQKRRVDHHYYQRRDYGDEKLELLPSSHIVGSAQALVETNYARIGYTGDFKIDRGTIVIEEPDALIIEATYGHPRLRRKFKNEIWILILDIVNEALRKNGKIVIYGYHGKLQEIMYMLRRNGIVEPFLMNRRVYNVTRVVERYMGEIRNYYDLSTSIGNAILRTGNYILFEHFVKVGSRAMWRDALKLVLSGWEFNKPIKRIDEYTWLVPFSSHGDFDDLVYYVEESRPRLVVVDGSRTGYPTVFASILREKGWNAIVLPR